MKSAQEENEPVAEGLWLKDPRQWAEFKGKVVAIVDHEIRASGDTHTDCYRAARELGVSMDEVEYFMVPRHRLA